MNYKKLLILIIFSAGILVRTYNYQERITFGPEQAMSLITSGRMVTEKFTLLGNQNLQRLTSAGHNLFAGALFNYSLIPLQVIFNYHPLPITFYFTLLNILTGIVLYKVIWEIVDQKVAIVTTVLFLFAGVSIYHSMFIWNQNYLFLLGALTVYVLYKFKNTFDYKYVVALGILTGVGISVQDLYILTLLIVYFALFYVSENRTRDTLLFVFAVLIPNLPQIIFDLRHDFYHLSTSWIYLSESLQGSSDASLKYYQFLHFYPVIYMLAGYLIVRIMKDRTYLLILALLVYSYLNLNSDRVDYKGPTGMPEELTLRNIYRGARVIVEDDPGNFNVVTLTDFDTRGHILRYPLEFEYGLKPLGVIEYPQSEVVYALAEDNYDFVKSDVWELSTFDKESAEVLSKISKSYNIYKITK